MKVAVVGAGFAGLRCAQVLGQKGIQVTIFEARDRVGGRVAQDEIGGHLIDLGANWIHGAENNPINTLAQASNTHVHEFTHPPAVISRTGQPLESQKATQTTSFVWKTIDEAFEYSRRHGAGIPADRSLFDFIRERVVQKGLSVEDQAECLEFSRVWGSYVGDAVETQSLRFFWLEECPDESITFVASTYRGILRLLATAALRAAEIRYNTPVLHVQRQSRPGPDPGQTPGRVRVTTHDGTYAFDQIVVTCPLGWLKRNKAAAFTPSLPERLTQAIDNISYGRLEKVYITFPEAFWSSTATATASASTTVFQDPIYTPSPSTNPWNQDCFALNTLPEGTAHPTLLFYLYGANATAVVQRIACLTPQTPEYNNVLDALFRPIYARLPGFNTSSPSCTPQAFRATTWQADPYAGHGSYCNFQVGLQAGDEDLAVLRDGDGLRDSGVWFAGEHTAPVEALGTTTGALTSGERVANDIARMNMQL